MSEFEKFIPAFSAIAGAGATIYSAYQGKKAAKKQGEALQQVAQPYVPTTPTGEPAPEPVMPLPDDEKVMAAKRRSLAEQMKRRGRASTILTAEDTLGG